MFEVLETEVARVMEYKKEDQVLQNLCSYWDLDKRAGMTCWLYLEELTINRTKMQITPTSQYSHHNISALHHSTLDKPS